MQAEIRKTIESSARVPSSPIVRYLSRKYRSRETDDAGTRMQEKAAPPIPDKTTLHDLLDNNSCVNLIAITHSWDVNLTIRSCLVKPYIRIYCTVVFRPTSSVAV